MRQARIVERPVKTVTFGPEHVHVLWADGYEECWLSSNWNRCTAGIIDWATIPETRKVPRYHNGYEWARIGRLR